MSLREISRITELSRVTVRRWIQSNIFPEISSKPPKPKLIDAWQGSYNATQLWNEMIEAGFSGGIGTVRNAVFNLCKGNIYPMNIPMRMPSASQNSRWLTLRRIIRGEENYASRFINCLCDKEPQFKLAKKLALAFYKILKTKEEKLLNK